VTSLTTASAAGAANSPRSPGKVSDPSKLAQLRDQVRNGTLHETHGSVSPCQAHNLHCRYQLVTTSRSSLTALTTTAPTGWGAKALQTAFGLNRAPTSPRMITIIGVGAYPTLAADLGVYRSTYGMTPCTVANKCLKIADYKGGPALRPSSPSDEEDLAVETALDVQMASAACPTCKITYLGVPVSFGDTAMINAFATATRTAVALNTASVSISYGFPTNSSIDRGAASQSMRQPGTAIFSASGDFGYMGPATFQSAVGGWPQNLRTVVSAGGTRMRAAQGAPTGYVQSMWSGAGSGCSPDLSPAVGQLATVSVACNGHRAVSDVSAVADNVAVYDTYAPFSGAPPRWITVGGTSASSPFLAGMAARAPRVSTVIGPNVLYAAPASAFADVTTGRNGADSDCLGDHVWLRLCVSRPGWDGGTGRGIPRGLAPFAAAK
jgi:hypothetical protein